MRGRSPLNVILVVLLSFGGWAWAEAPATLPTTAPSAAAARVNKAVPENLGELRALQARVRSVVAKVSPAVVGLRTRGAGSGVIISEDGLILTAGHVTMAPGRSVWVKLNSGEEIRAKSLGINYGADSGLVKITDPAYQGKKWPFVEMGHSAGLEKGQWCVAMGHPGGFRTGRTPPVRLGRILSTNERWIRSDCTLVGGDSGGPLFDLDGRVIGVHSRIGNTLNDNLHVPVETYHETWERLAKGDAWGIDLLSLARRNASDLGFRPDKEASDCRVGEVVPGTSAEAAGLKPGDVILRVNRAPIANVGEYMLALTDLTPGEEVPVEVKRGETTLKVKLTVARRGDSRRRPSENSPPRPQQSPQTKPSTQPQSKPVE